MSVKRIRRRKHGQKRVSIGAPDPSLTTTSGAAAAAEFADKLDVVGRFDRAIGAIKQRPRGVTAGELLVGLAQSQLLGREWAGRVGPVAPAVSPLNHPPAPTTPLAAVPSSAPVLLA